MNLTAGEVAELPLAAALFDGDELLARTPEWTGAVAGAVSYRVRRARLVVATEDTHPLCAPLLGRLFGEVEAAAAILPHRQALRLHMLAASLRVVAGRATAVCGTSQEVLEHACAGIAMRTALDVDVEEADAFPVVDPAVAALVLVQFAANAEGHDHARSVTLRAAQQAFTVAWEGARGAAATATGRRREERVRWGLGFARIAADSIGAAVYPPVDCDGRRSAGLEVGVERLALPLALLHGGLVRKATRSWDEETGLLPGYAVSDADRAGRCAAEATAAPASVVGVDGWRARSGRDGTWVAIPPDTAGDRARDVLDGMVHERALWETAPEPARSHVVALAAILAALLGADLVRVPGTTWNRRAAEAAAVYGLRMAVPVFRGAGAVDPRVALFLAAEFGEALETDGDDLLLRIAPRHREDPLVRVFLAEGADCVLLS